MITELKALWQEAFADNRETVDAFFQTGFSPDRWEAVLQDGQLASALYWFDCAFGEKKIAYIYAVATRKEFQNRGLCRRLMENTHKKLAQKGYAGAIVVPASEGLVSLYERLGYRVFCSVNKQEILPGAAVPVKEISAAAYRQLRQEKCPQGVFHSRQAYDWLETYAAFYTAGENLFCISRQGDQVYFQEFLGKSEALPGIVAGLKAEKGFVRLPGGDAPFAMFYNIAATRLPTYFALPMD